MLQYLIFQIPAYAGMTVNRSTSQPNFTVPVCDRRRLEMLVLIREKGYLGLEEEIELIFSEVHDEQFGNLRSVR